MAEDQEQPDGRTEEATPHRREEARKKGQVAYSVDLSSAFNMLAGALVLWLAGVMLGGSLTGMIRSHLAGLHEYGQDFGWQETHRLATDSLGTLAQITGTILAIVFAVSLAAGILQSGLRATAEPLKPNWSRLSPVSGWSRLLSGAAFWRGAMSLLKTVIVGFVVWWVLKGRLAGVSLSGRGTFQQAIANGWRLAVEIALGVAAAYVLLGLLDYLFQRLKHEKELRMSRREIKEEHKQQEGDPQVKSRIRRMQREVAQQRMIKDVPKATVIVTNPTHFAVALQYDRASMAAPKVVAKGANLFAKRIVKVARQHGIPVLERKPLAQALFATAEIGQEIPIALYQAVAEILAFVYRLGKAA